MGNGPAVSLLLNNVSGCMMGQWAVSVNIVAAGPSNYLEILLMLEYILYMSLCQSILVH